MVSVGEVRVLLQIPCILFRVQLNYELKKGFIMAKQIIGSLNCAFFTFVSVIERICEFVTVIGFVLLILLVTLQVIGRYLLANPVYWSEELARYVFVWTSWFGASLALRRYQLIALTFIAEKLPVQYQKRLKIVNLLLITGFIFLFTKYGIVLLNLAKKGQTVSPALTIPMYYVYYIFPFVGVIMFIFSITSLIEFLQGKN